MFLERVLPELRDGEAWRLEFFTGTGPKRYFKLDVMQTAAEKWAKKNTADIYFAVASFTGDSRKVEDVARLQCLWVDLDVGPDKAFPTREHALEALGMFALQPSAIVDSGYGYHVFWALEHPVEDEENIERVIRLVRGLAKLLDGDLNVADASRVMRIPGTLNCKHNEQAQVTLVGETDNRYTLTQFVEAGVQEVGRVSEEAPTPVELSDGSILKRGTIKASGPMLALLETTGSHGDEYDSGSEADFALICALLRGDHSPADVAATFTASKRGDDAQARKPGHYDDYLQRTMESAQRAVKADRPALPALASILKKRRVDVSPEDRIALLAELGHRLSDVQVTEVRRYLGDVPVFVFYTDGGVVKAGAWDGVVNLRRFRGAFEGTTGEVIRAYKEKEWSQVREIILKAAVDIEVHEEATESGQVKAWVGDWLQETPPPTSDEEQFEAADNDDPFMNEGRVCITVTGFTRYIKTVVGERSDRLALARALRANGWDYSKINIMDGDRRTSKRVFSTTRLED